MSDAELRAQLSLSLGAKYILDREIDGGGRSRTFVAQELTNDREVVVKVLPFELTQGASAERFDRELHLMFTLQEPHTVPILTAGQTADGHLYYTMPFVHAPSLRERVSQGPLGFDESVLALTAVALAMQQAHRQGIVHRNLSPNKVLMLRGTAVVTDFGVARALELARSRDSGSHLKLVGSVVGEEEYMAPEHTEIGIEEDHRADIYAWGVMAYELFFEGQPLPEQLSETVDPERQANEFAAVLSHKRYGVPRQLAELVIDCVSTHPDDRPQSADEILEVLGRIPDSATALAIESKTTARWIGASIVLAVVLFFAGATAVWRLQHTGPAISPVLVVVPFENVGVVGDSTFADGLQNSVIDKLSELSNLRVVDRRSLRSVLGQRGSVRETGRMLGADYVLRATLRWFRDADGTPSVQVSPTLLSVSDGVTKWAGKPEVAFSADPFSLQTSLALETAQEIGVRLSKEERTALEKRATTDTAAFAAFARGERIYWQNDDPALNTLQLALSNFERAYALDRNYVDALGNAAFVLTRMGRITGRREFMDSAARPVRIARALGPSDPHTLTAAAELELFHNLPLSAQTLVEKAIFAAPSFREAISLHAELMLLSGDSAAAWRDVDRLRSIALHSTDALLSMTETAAALRRFRDAREFLRRARVINPGRVDLIIRGAHLAQVEGDLTGVARGVRAFREAGGQLAAADLVLLRAGDESMHAELASASPAQYGIETRADSLDFYMEKAQLYLARHDSLHATALIDTASAILEVFSSDTRVRLTYRRRYDELRAWTDAARGQRTPALSAITRADRSPIAEQWANGRFAAFAACNGAEIFAFLGDIDLMLPQLKRCLTLPGGYTPRSILMQPALSRYATEPRVRALLESLPADLSHNE